MKSRKVRPLLRKPYVLPHRAGSIKLHVGPWSCCGLSYSVVLVWGLSRGIDVVTILEGSCQERHKLNLNTLCSIFSLTLGHGKNQFWDVLLLSWKMEGESGENWELQGRMRFPRCRDDVFA